MADFFFYGTLCHPPLLSAVLGREAVLSPARLLDHASHWVEGGAFPMITAAPGAAAEGVLATGISEEEAARLDYYEGGFAYSVREVLLETDKGASAVTARVYFPDVSRLRPGGAWDLARWREELGEAAVLAAHHFMEGYGTVPQARAMERYPSLLARAVAEVRARGAAPTELRRRAGPGDVEIREFDAPYSEFFAVHDYDLRHRRFDGSMSDEMRRSVFVAADAASVLPYDPSHDLVALIEQFRTGPLARGDTQPWMLEAVAGRIDSGESPEQTVRREAVEEAGIEIGALYPSGAYYPSPGALSEYVYSFVGIADLAAFVPRIGGLEEEQEDIRTHVLSFDALMALVASGEIQNGPLLLTIYWLAANRAHLRAGA